MAMIEPTSDTTGLPMSSQLQSDKIIILNSTDVNTATFSIKDEDHTVGNSLRFMIMKNPEVMFCGYSIPHPSEFKIHIRIQTNGNITALEALLKGLDDLSDLCSVLEDEFKSSKSRYVKAS